MPQPFVSGSFSRLSIVAMRPRGRNHLIVALLVLVTPLDPPHRIIKLE